MNKVVINLYFIENVLKFTNLQILGTQVSDNYFWLDKRKKNPPFGGLFYLIASTIALKASGLFSARSASAFLLSSIFFL